jgi:hypothetical protein
VTRQHWAVGLLAGGLAAVLCAALLLAVRAPADPGAWPYVCRVVQPEDLDR